MTVVRAGVRRTTPLRHLAPRLRKRRREKRKGGGRGEEGKTTGKLSPGAADGGGGGPAQAGASAMPSRLMANGGLMHDAPTLSCLFDRRCRRRRRGGGGLSEEQKRVWQGTDRPADMTDWGERDCHRSITFRVSTSKEGKSL